MRIEFDQLANAAYIYLVSNISQSQVEKTYICTPMDIKGQINLDFDAQGHLLGIEILDATQLLNYELLQVAEKL